MKMFYNLYLMSLMAGLVLLSTGVNAQDINDAIRGYVWADQESSSSYTPDPDYSYNSSGAGVEINSPLVGEYYVTFFGLGSVGLSGNVQVTPYGSDAHCVVRGWDSVGSDLEIDIFCFNPAGIAVDTKYNVLFMSASGTISGLAYAWANNETAASYTPSALYSYNSAGGSITAERSGTGEYSINFQNISGASSDLGHVQVSAYGSGNEFCAVDSWFGDNIGVNCYDVAGNPVDVRYTILYMESTGSENGLGYAYAPNETTSSYTPPSAYSHNSAGGAITATRSGTGSYGMLFDDLGGEDFGGHVQVSSYDFAVGGAVHCNTAGWSSSGDIGVSVRCYDESGDLVDSQYDVLVVFPNRVPVANESGAELPTALQLHAAYPNPFNPSTILSYSIPEAGDVDIRVYDTLGREIAQLVNGQKPSGTHEVSFDASGLPSGVYVVRMEASGVVRAQRVTLAR